MAKVMTVTDLRKKLKGLPGHLIVVSADDDVPDSKFGIDTVENDGSFCILRTKNSKKSFVVTKRRIRRMGPRVSYARPLRG